MSWIDRLNTAIDQCVDDAVARERERCAKLAEQWADSRKPEHGGNALRNFADALRNPAAYGVAPSNGGQRDGSPSSPRQERHR